MAAAKYNKDCTLQLNFMSYKILNDTKNKEKKTNVLLVNKNQKKGKKWFGGICAYYDTNISMSILRRAGKYQIAATETNRLYGG